MIGRRRRLRRRPFSASREPTGSGGSGLLPRAITGDAFGDPDAVERALDLAVADKMLFPFLVRPEPGLLDYQARHRAAAALISEAVDLLVPAARLAPPGELTRPVELLTKGETRVLR